MSNTPARLNLTVYQGSTLTEVLRWESSTKSYAVITGISKTAPVVITAPGHGIPSEWRVKLSNIGGMIELNTGDEYHQVSDITTNTFTINSVNSTGYKLYTTGGIVEFNTPINLTGYTARMQIRESINNPVVVHELTTANGGITFNTSNYSITLNIPASVTTGFTFMSAVYSLEVVSSGGLVSTLTVGNVGLVKEVTR